MKRIPTVALTTAVVGLTAVLSLAPSAAADPLFPGGPDIPGFHLPGGPKPLPQLGRANFSTPSFNPSNGETVGVAQPIIVSFDAPVDDRATALRALRVTTVPAVAGRFYWTANDEVRWRPTKGLWPAKTKVTVEAGKAKSSFSIGDAWVATSDDNTHTITVTLNGKVIRTMPTSMGSNAHPTPNGTYTVGERFRDMYMDSSTYGVPVDSPGGYRTYVEYATRISNGGIFVHAAPWSVAQQGRSNTSHGCLNVSVADGKWFFENAPRGAPVIVVNTVGGQIGPADGLTDFSGR
ncbi:L,D-transpeptidase [Williamsia sp. CHRR-6]|uniref:L,D-transpeptidase n=1 Tax=Williamsia sp. CHRR-6 TaxID=2835871 RepID=UPI001BDAF682|nr:L,D-transpeptidase [Williamsia sp. CHRR-6]MBT0567509.1 L,D-transpeptidase [Williamsia sp. CHRR-6]